MVTVSAGIDIDQFRLCELGPYTTAEEYTPRKDLEQVKHGLVQAKAEHLDAMLERLDAVEDAIGSARKPCEALSHRENGSRHVQPQIDAFTGAGEHGENGYPGVTGEDDPSQEYIQLFVTQYHDTGNAFEAMNKPFKQFLSDRYDLELLQSLTADDIDSLVDAGRTVLEQGEPVKIGLYLDPESFPDDFASTPPPEMDMSKYDVKAVVAPPTHYTAQVNRLKSMYTQILRDARMEQPVEPGEAVDTGHGEPERDIMFH